MELQNLIQIHEEALVKFQPYWDEGDTNARMFRGQHWSTEQKAQHDKEFRKAYNIPLLATKMNRILSEQRNNRTQWKVKGVGAEDELGAEFGNYTMDYVDRINKFKWGESWIYQDGMAKKYGVLSVDKDFDENPQGDIILEKVSYKEFLWDDNASKYDLSDALFQQRFGWFTREQIADMFESVDADNLYSDTNNDVTYGDRKNWFQSINKKKESIKVVWHYEREKIKKKILIEGKQVSVSSYTVYVTAYSGTTILQKRTDTGRKNYPYAVFFSLFDDGKFWSLTDLARDTQQGFDRFLSMIDKSTVKNIKGNNYEVQPEKLHPMHQKSIDEVFDSLSQGGKYIATLAEGAIKPLQSHNDVVVESQMLQLMQSLLEDILGGRTFQGLESKVQQTATESKILESAAKMAGMLYLDNLSLWKQHVGELIWELIPEVYTEGRQIKIAGDENSRKIQALMQQYPQMQGNYQPSQFNPGEGFLKVPMNLGELNVDIEMDEVSGNSTMKEQQLQQLLSIQEMIVKAMPNSMPLPIEVFIPYLTCDATIKAKLTEHYEMLKQQKMKEQQMAEEQMNIEKFDRALGHQNKKAEIDGKIQNQKVDNILKIANSVPENKEEESEY